MVSLSEFEKFKEELLAIIGELKMAARERKHSLAKFLCHLLIKALAAPKAKRFVYDADLERNTLSVLKDQYSPHGDIDYPLSKVKAHIEYYLGRCDGFTVWEKASIATCQILVMYYEKKILHTTTVKALFSLMTAKAKNETREAKRLMNGMFKKEKRK